MRSLGRVLTGSIIGYVVGLISFAAGVPVAIPIAIGCVLFFAMMLGTVASEEMRGRYRVYVIAAFGACLALSVLIAANPH
jgi:hypothetical protein